MTDWKYLVSIDPGMSTGVVTGRYADRVEFQPTAVLQIPGGLPGVEPHLAALGRRYQEGVIVSESFSPRPGARSWRLDELEPLRIEGWLYGHWGSRVIWRRPESRKLIRDDHHETELALREMGYWTLPRSVGQKDANDANSAMMHALGALRDLKHGPTLAMLVDYGVSTMEGNE